MKLIPLSRGKFAKVDDTDFKKFGPVKWYAALCGKHLYAKRDTGRDSKRSRHYLHREIMGNPVGKQVDHKNHDTLDCQKSNLRVCNQSQNMMNRRGAASHSKSGIRGVHWHRGAEKWTSQIRAYGVVYHLGLFVEKEDAAAAYLAARKKYFGEFMGGS